MSTPADQMPPQDSQYTLAPSAVPEGTDRGVQLDPVNTVPAPPAPKTYGDGADLEQRAREMGWTPEAEFRESHPQGQWRTAEDFVARDGHVNQPKETLVQRSMDYDALNAKYDALKGSVQQLSEIANKSYLAGLAEREAQAKAAHAEAVDNGDQAAALTAASEMARYDADRRSVESAAQPDTQAIATQVQNMDQQFTMQNTWLNADPMAASYFRDIVQQNTRIDPNTGYPDPMAHQQVLEMAKNQVLNQRPELAGVNPNRAAAQPMTAPGQRQPLGSPAQRGPSFEHLDTMQQQMCMSFVNSGAYGKIDTPEARGQAIQAYVNELAATGALGQQ